MWLPFAFVEAICRFICNKITAPSVPVSDLQRKFNKAGERVTGVGRWVDRRPTDGALSLPQPAGLRLIAVPGEITANKPTWNTRLFI